MSEASCEVPEPLSQKYSVPRRNAHPVLVARHRSMDRQVFWNPRRNARPQTFDSASEAASADPTAGRGCDFCDPLRFTAADAWGRVENEHALTASNLFKITSSHGVIILRSHDPYDWNLAQLRGMIRAAGEWFVNEHGARPEAPECGALIWNSLQRAGASQYHPHLQAMLTPHGMPEQVRAWRGESEYHRRMRDGGRGMWEAEARAHDGAGLLHGVTDGEDAAWVYPSMCPLKDMEVVVLGESLCSPAFTLALYSALRTLIDDLGLKTWNMGILNLEITKERTNVLDTRPPPLSTDPTLWRPVWARIVSRGKPTTQSSDFGGLEVMLDASTGHTDPYFLSDALARRLRECADAAGGGYSKGWQRP
ncbi:unnamed protein product [Pedinophyceae sp. YPF-701]|nr:unnamed protein product [Pedinophyceae sp. YPF-701]